MSRMTSSSSTSAVGTGPRTGSSQPAKSCQPAGVGTPAAVMTTLVSTWPSRAIASDATAASVSSTINPVTPL